MTRQLSSLHVYPFAVLISMLLSVLLVPAAWGLSSDSDKPMEILANSAELDDKKGVTIYRGDVEVTQGTLFMSGHTLTVYYDENQELDHAIMEGDLAYYKQLPDGSKVYDEAWAKRMEYYSSKALVVLIREAKVVQEDVRFTGDRIEYDTVNSRVIARSDTGKKQADAETDETREDGRVRVIITPKKDAADSE